MSVSRAYFSALFSSALAHGRRVGFRFLYFLYVNTRLGLWYHRRNLKKSHEREKPSGHSKTKLLQFGNLNVYPVPMLDDNYAYIMFTGDSNEVVVVDPSDATTVINVLTNNKWIPKAVLTTHKHWDHSGGNMEISRQYPGVEIYSSAVDNAYGANRFIDHMETFSIAGLDFLALLTPGHTLGHVVYKLVGTSHGAPDCLFTGDLLFLAGCGKFFEGTVQDVYTSLSLVVSSCSHSALVWPGHEYAYHNLLFASQVDLNNKALMDKFEWVREQRKDRLPTCPSTIGEELSYNPFLRTHVAAIHEVCGILQVSASHSSSSSISMDINKSLADKNTGDSDLVRPKPQQSKGNETTRGNANEVELNKDFRLSAGVSNIQMKGMSNDLLESNDLLNSTEVESVTGTDILTNDEVVTSDEYITEDSEVTELANRDTVETTLLSETEAVNDIETATIIDASFAQMAKDIDESGETSTLLPNFVVAEVGIDVIELKGMGSNTSFRSTELYVEVLKRLREKKDNFRP